MSKATLKNFRLWILGLFAAVLPALALAGPLDGLTDTLKGAAPSLTGIVAQKYGLSDNQAAGGIGSILSLAKEKLKAGDYTQLTGSIPDAAGYVQKAKSLGAVTGKLGNLQGLNGAFGKLGISPEVGSQLISTVVDYAGKLGGGKTGALLSSVLK